jgi:hypothetical protein
MLVDDRRSISAALFHPASVLARGMGCILARQLTGSPASARG